MDDAGHLMALEAFLFAAVFLGAVASMAALAPEATEAEDPLEFIAADALASLAEAPGPDGEPLLDPLVAHAARCAANATPQDCLAAGPAAVRSRLRAYLPSGTGYALELSNGVGRIPLAPAAEWEGPSVSSSIPYAPQSKHGLAAPALSCSAADAPLRAQAVFVRNGNARLPRSVAFDTGESSVLASRAGDVWRADIAPSTGATTLTARSTSPHGATTAVATVATCALGETQTALLASLETATLAFASATHGGTMHPGSDIVVSRNLSALALVPGVTLLGATLEIHSPLAAGEPMWTLRWGSAPSGEETWRIPTAAMHGCHPTVLRASLAVAVDGGLQVEARRLGTLCVTLPGGELPPEPMYRISLRVWQEGGHG